MAFLPDELQIDETVDTHRIAPEDDFASPSDPRIPRKQPNATTGDGSSGGDSYYGAQPRFAQPVSRDLEHQQFMQPAHGNLPNTFTQGTPDMYPSTQQPTPEYVADLLEHNQSQRYDPQSGNVPAVEPGQDEGNVDQQQEDYPEDLLAAAGLTLEQAQDDFGSVEAVQAAVRMLDQRYVTDGRSALITQQNHNVQQDIIVDDQFQLPQPEGSDDWDDDTKRLVGAMTDRFNVMLSKRDEQVKSQQDELAAQLRSQQQKSAEQELADFDAMVNSLPDDWMPYLGKGTAYDLDRSGLAFQNRTHLDRTMMSLQEGARLAGRAMIPREELLMRALGVAFPEVQRTVIRNEVVQEVGQRQQMMTARPTQRRQPAQTPFQKAGQTAEDWYRKHNMANDDFDEFEL